MPTLSEFIGAEILRQQQENEQLANNIMNYMNVMYQAQAGREAKQAERQYKAQEELNRRQFDINKLEYTQQQENERQLKQQEFQRQLEQQKAQQALELEQTRQAGNIELEKTKARFKAGQVKPATTSFMNAKANYESALSEFEQFRKDNLSGGYFVFGENKYEKKDGEWYKVTATGKIGDKETVAEKIKYLNTKNNEYIGIKNKQKKTENLYNLYLQSGGNIEQQTQSTTGIKPLSFYEQQGDANANTGGNK